MANTLLGVAKGRGVAEVLTIGDGLSGGDERRSGRLPSPRASTDPKRTPAEALQILAGMPETEAGRVSVLMPHADLPVDVKPADLAGLPVQRVRLSRLTATRPTLSRARLETILGDLDTAGTRWNIGEAAPNDHSTSKAYDSRQPDRPSSSPTADMPWASKRPTSTWRAGRERSRPQPPRRSNASTDHRGGRDDHGRFGEGVATPGRLERGTRRTRSDSTAREAEDKEVVGQAGKRKKTRRWTSGARRRTTEFVDNSGKLRRRQADEPSGIGEDDKLHQSRLGPRGTLSIAGRQAGSLRTKSTQRRRAARRTH